MGLCFYSQRGKEGSSGLTLKGVLLRSEAEPATTPLVEQARAAKTGSGRARAYGTYVRSPKCEVEGLRRGSRPDAVEVAPGSLTSGLAPGSFRWNSSRVVRAKVEEEWDLAPIG